MTKALGYPKFVVQAGDWVGRHYPMTMNSYTVLNPANNSIGITPAPRDGSYVSRFYAIFALQRVCGMDPTSSQYGKYQ